MRSDNVKKGMQQAPHRSLFNALGFTKEEMDKPMIGIVSSYNEIVPGHMNLDKMCLDPLRALPGPFGQGFTRLVVHGRNHREVKMIMYG